MMTKIGETIAMLIGQFAQGFCFCSGLFVALRLILWVTG
jgi:hypothetical protein